jgi:ribonuclease HI
MAQGIDSTKSAARPSHEAIEQETVATEAGESAQRRLDQIAMEAAKRSSNRIIANEENIPSSTIFSK